MGTIPVLRFFFTPHNGKQLASINNLAPTTELEAINEMLGAAGEGPITAVDASTKCVIAVDVLRKTTRELLTARWRFNTEFGYELSPSATFNWTDTQDITVQLNIFKPPASMIAWRLTPDWSQQGSNYVDTMLRKSTHYTEAGLPVLVFYDRAFNRDGFVNSFLYIDPVWLMDFEDMPEQARNYATVVAARRYARRVTGSAELSGLLEKDERIALRTLRREYGLTDNFNIFDNADVSQILGGRARGPSGVSEWRASPGFKP